MSNWIENIARSVLTSFGLKRRIVALISTLIGLSAAIPALLPFVPVLQSISAWLGGAALAHAAVSGTVLKPGVKSLSFASVLQLLIGVLATQSNLAQFVPLLQVLATILGIFGLGVASEKVKK